MSNQPNSSRDICNCRFYNQSGVEVQTHIFAEDLLPGCPIIEDLPYRHRILLYPKYDNEINLEERKSEKSIQYNEVDEQRRKDGRTFMYIGPNGTIISKLEFYTIQWDSLEACTQSLLTILFDYDTLATHSVPGKLSSRHQQPNGIPRLPLDPLKVKDVLYFVKKRFQCKEREVRNAIIKKCMNVTEAGYRSKWLGLYPSI
ncbi:protein insensitive-like [Bactrocera tryoni]|uniref:protein insensitive-like n=1 Tax=Bactrocera tryoni TaxID=59916 RepID=UPI001A9573A4|nr:protein insensitive-like [Bactrocera tryoni]